MARGLPCCHGPWHERPGQPERPVPTRITEPMIISAHTNGHLTRAKRILPRPGAGFAFPWLVAVLCFLLAAPSGARIVKNEDASVEEDPRMVFGMIARAWEQGDQQALADLVHKSGLKVTAGGNPDRSTNYSPSQAFYYFKNLFQSHRSLVLVFDTMQDASAGDRVHGMAVWKRRRPDSERVQEVKLVFALARQDDLWRLAEINQIR